MNAKGDGKGEELGFLDPWKPCLPISIWVKLKKRDKRKDICLSSISIPPIGIDNILREEKGRFAR